MRRKPNKKRRKSGRGKKRGTIIGALFIEGLAVGLIIWAFFTIRAEPLVEIETDNATPAVVADFRPGPVGHRTNSMRTSSLPSENQFGGHRNFAGLNDGRMPSSNHDRRVEGNPVVSRKSSPAPRAYGGFTARAVDRTISYQSQPSRISTPYPYNPWR